MIQTAAARHPDLYGVEATLGRAWPEIPAVPEYYRASEYWPKASLERRALLRTGARA